MKVKLAQSRPTPCDSMNYTVHGILQNTGVGSHSLSPGELPNPGIELGSPASQADSLPTELSGMGIYCQRINSLTYHLLCCNKTNPLEQDHQIVSAWVCNWRNVLPRPLNAVKESDMVLIFKVSPINFSQKEKIRI